MNIDLNRGVLMRVHPITGVNVYMYRDEPGVWLNAYGTPVDKKLADECGFDTAKYDKEKLKKERMAEAQAIIERELDGSNTTRKVVTTREGFKLIEIGGGRYIVEDPDGNNLTTMPLPNETATSLFDQLAPKPKAEAKVPKKAQAKKAEVGADLPEEPASL